MTGSQSQSHRALRKPKGEGYERRAEILAVAQKLFVEQGYEGATIRKIANAIGLSSTALYMHFPDKAAILNEICKGAFEALILSSNALLAQEAPPEVRLRHMTECYIRFGFDNPNAYRLTYLMPPLDPVNGPVSDVRETGNTLFDLFVSAVQEAVTAGRMVGDPKTLAKVIWATAHGLVALQISKPYFDWSDRDELVRIQMDALFKGLLHN